MTTSFVQPLKKFIEKHALVIMILACVIYLAHLTALSFLNHQGLRTQLNDLGHMEQAIWQVTQGDLQMHVTDPIVEPTSRFYYHANLVFYLIAPLYALFPSAYTILFVGVASAAAAGLLIFLLAQKILKNNIYALLFGLAFLANPLMQETVLYDFHAILIACPFLILALLSLENKKLWLFWLSIIMILIAQEDMPFLVIAFVPLIAFYYSKLQAVLVFSAAVSYWIFLRTGLSNLIGEKVGGYMWHRLGEFGSTPEEAIKTILNNPLQAITDRINNHRIVYLSYLYIQGTFLAIWAPMVLFLAIPNLAQNILVGGDYQVRITGVYYSGIIITAIFMAAIYGMRRTNTLMPNFTQYILFPLFIIQAIIISVIFSPTPYGMYSHMKDYGIYHDRAVFREIKNTIPATASVATQNNIGAHFAARDVIVKPTENVTTDYIVLHLQNPHAEDNGLFLRNAGMSIAGNPFLNTEDLKNNIQTQLIDHAFHNNNYGVVMYESSFYLFKRGHNRSLNPSAYNTAMEDLQNIHR